VLLFRTEGALSLKAFANTTPYCLAIATDRGSLSHDHVRGLFAPVRLRSASRRKLNIPRFRRSQSLVRQFRTHHLICCVIRPSSPNVLSRPHNKMKLKENSLKTVLNCLQPKQNAPAVKRFSCLNQSLSMSAVI